RLEDPAGEEGEVEEVAPDLHAGVVRVAQDGGRGEVGLVRGISLAGVGVLAHDGQARARAAARPAPGDQVLAPRAPRPPSPTASEGASAARLVRATNGSNAPARAPMISVATESARTPPGAVTL